MDTKLFLKPVGVKIRAARKAKKLSQEKLAELADLHPTFISDVERGKTNASLHSYYSIAKALGVPLSDIVSISSGKIDRLFEAELTEMITFLRALDKKKQGIFLSAAKGLLSGIDKA